MRRLSINECPVREPKHNVARCRQSSPAPRFTPREAFPTPITLSIGRRNRPRRGLPQTIGNAVVNGCGRSRHAGNGDEAIQLQCR